MPTRKSNISQVATTGDETTPSKEIDGVNIEVNDTIVSLSLPPPNLFNGKIYLSLPCL